LPETPTQRRVRGERHERASIEPHLLTLGEPLRKSDGKPAAPRSCALVETLQRRQTCRFDVSNACARRREVNAHAVMSEGVFGLLHAFEQLENR